MLKLHTELILWEQQLNVHNFTRALKITLNRIIAYLFHQDNKELFFEPRAIKLLLQHISVGLNKRFLLKVGHCRDETLNYYFVAITALTFIVREVDIINPSYYSWISIQG
jgi:hypothetical protein